MKKVLASITVCTMLALLLCLSACNSKVEFKVNFVVDGETYSTISTSGEEIISIPQNPTKEGYEFDGWFWDEGQWKRPFTANSLLNEPLSSDMSVYAKWTEINVEPEQPNIDISSSVLEVSGEKATATVSNTTTIFSFLNDIKFADEASYILANDIGCQNVIASKTVALEEGDNTYYLLVTNGNAQKLYTITIRRRPIYTVEFNTNGGTKVETLHIEEDSTIEMQQTSKTGYSFNYWSVNNSQIEFPYQVKKDEIVVANWSVISYTIEYELNNGTNNVENVSNYTIEQTVELKNPTRDYYRFDGWFETVDFTGTPVSKINQGTTGNKTLYAKWTPIQYEIKYKLNGGTNNESNIFAYNTEQEITLKDPTRDGYAFLGWFANDNFEGSAIEKIALGSNGNKELYAKWQACENKLVFNGNGSTSGSMVDLAIDTDETVSLENNKFEKLGYTFKGWSTTADGSVEFADGASYTMGTGSTYTLYAVWEATKFNITYVLNLGESNENNPSSYTIEDVITLKNPTINSTYYDFLGWYTDADFANQIIEIKNNSSDITLYAKWITNDKALTFTQSGAGYSVTDCVLDIDTVIIPETYNGLPVTSIGSNALYYCTSLTKMTIPNSVTYIANNAFHYCPSLTNIEVNANNTKYKSIDGNLYTIDGKTLVQYAVAKTDTTFEIPNSVTYIREYAFYSCDSLKNITIGSGVISIGSYAFSNCASLTNLTIGSSVTSIGSTAFGNCTSLTINYLGTIENWCNISFEDAYANPLYYAKKLYINEKLVTSLVIPNTVTKIKDYALYNCTGLISVTIPSSVTSIGYLAFYNCVDLTSVIIPSSVTEISSNAFMYGNIIIYCEAKSKPSGWSSSWNVGNSVVWGYNSN